MAIQCLAGCTHWGGHGGLPSLTAAAATAPRCLLQAAKAKQTRKAVELFEAMSTSGVQVGLVCWLGRAGLPGVRSVWYHA